MPDHPETVSRAGRLPDGRGSSALAYFLTLRAYGTWLHGEPGAVDRRRNIYGDPGVPVSAGLRAARRASLRHPPASFDATAREVVMGAVEEVCDHRGWSLLALHVRTDHVHALLAAPADVTPERIMNDLKSYATRHLREGGLFGGRPVWSRHGSTRHLFQEWRVRRAVRYTVLEQGPWLDPAPGWDTSLLSAAEVDEWLASEPRP